MATTQRKTGRTTSSSGRSRSRAGMAAAATLVPLALGLAGNVSTPTASQPHPSPHPLNEPIAISCTLPFAAIQRHHAIDDSCPAPGNADPSSSTDRVKREVAQNLAKNNFCASNAPVNIDFDVLHQLQQEAASVTTFGSDMSLPKDRSVLRQLDTKVGKIGEGMLVRIAAFVIHAKPANVGQGESVNCKMKPAEDNDIHIALGQNSNQDEECSSVTAEMSPHFRPDSWTSDNITQNNARLFRITGQLFFDANHKPCKGTTGQNPKRSSLWEIHPVYGIEICGDSRNSCKVDSDENWIALSDFVGPGLQEEDASGDESRAGTPRTFHSSDLLADPL